MLSSNVLYIPATNATNTYTNNATNDNQDVTFTSSNVIINRNRALEHFNMVKTVNTMNNNTIQSLNDSMEDCFIELLNNINICKHEMGMVCNYESKTDHEKKVCMSIIQIVHDKMMSNYNKLKHIRQTTWFVPNAYFRTAEELMIKKNINIYNHTIDMIKMYTQLDSTSHLKDVSYISRIIM